MATDKLGIFGAATGGAIFDLVRRNGPITRAQLVRRTGLSKSTVSLQTDRLLRMGLIREEAKETGSGPGRRSVLRFATDRGVVVGVELGATSVDMAICDLDAGVLASRCEPLDIAQGPVPVLQRVYQLADELLALPAGDERRLLGIGIGLPGPVDIAHGYVTSPPIMPGWDRYPVRDEVSDRFGVPCFVDNDVNVMAIGEARAGVGKELKDFLFIKVGTGIGCGIITDGQIYRGAQGSAGDIGHIAIDGETERCPCGNQGCLEVVAGGAAIARRGRELAKRGESPLLQSFIAGGDEIPGDITAIDVGRAASQGDAAAIDLVVTSGRHIGSVLAKLVNFFNPEMIILGGGVTNLGDVFVAAIREMVVSRSTALATAELVVRRSTFGEQSGMVGAAAMTVDELFSSREVTEMVKAFPG